MSSCGKMIDSSGSTKSSLSHQRYVVEVAGEEGKEEEEEESSTSSEDVGTEVEKRSVEESSASTSEEGLLTQDEKPTEEESSVSVPNEKTETEVGKRSEEGFWTLTRSEKLAVVEVGEETGGCRHSWTNGGFEEMEGWGHCRHAGQPPGVLEMATSLLEARVSRKEFSS